MALTAEATLLYGPFKSSRFGATISVDLGVQEGTLAVSRTNRMPRASVVVTTAAREVMRLSKAGDKAESLVVFGSVATPTAHPDFLEITENLRDLRNKWYSKAKLVLVAQTPLVEEYSVRRSMEIYDRVIIRIDWGTAKLFSSMTGRKTTELTQLAKTLSSLDKIVVETTFQRGKYDNSTAAELRNWIKRVQELTPIELHVSNLHDKVTGQKPVPPARMKELVAEATEKIGVPVTVLEQADPLLT